MPVDFGLLNYNMKALMEGLQKSPWVFDPAQLTGDATQNRARVYSGSATDPRTPMLAPGTYAPGTPGVSPSAGLPASTPQAAAMPLQAPASAVAANAPTQTAAMLAGAPSGSSSASATPSQGQADPNAPKDDFSSISWFDPDNVAKKFNDPAWQRQLNAATFGSNASGQQMPDGIMLTPGMAPPTSKDGRFFMTGSTPGGFDSGEGGAVSGRNTYGFVPNQQPAQIPADLQALVTQFLAGKPNG